MLRAGRDLTPAMRAVGEHLLNSTREPFVDQKAPDGTGFPVLAGIGAWPG